MTQKNKASGLFKRFQDKLFNNKTFRHDAVYHTHTKQQMRVDMSRVVSRGDVSSFMPQWTTALLLLVLERQKKQVTEKWDKRNFFLYLFLRGKVAAQEYLGHPLLTYSRVWHFSHF